MERFYWLGVQAARLTLGGMERGYCVRKLIAFPGGAGKAI